MRASRRRRPARASGRPARRDSVSGDGRLAAALLAPALVSIGLVALLPLGLVAVESLHRHDLRSPWQGRPFVGLANYGEAIVDGRFWAAVAHTLGFTFVTVSLELALGLALALALHRSFRGRALARTLALLPWALPTVVAALVWRFLFDGSGSLANRAALALGADAAVAWLAHPWLAWVPVVLADVWKTTPFVALLLLAGLQSADETLDEAARVDGASAVRRLWHVTLPLLRPALLVALLFRSIDALRLFDLVFVLTGGGPGTATEPLAVYTHAVLFRNLRFGYGSALSVLVFGIAFALALVYARSVGRRAAEGA